MSTNHTAGKSGRRRTAGAAAEKHACNKYGLTPDHSGKADAVKDGRPYEIKAAIRKKSDGRGGTKPGEFYIFEHAHTWLRRHDGRYVFVLYRFRGKGIQVLETKVVHASKLPYFTFHESGHPGRNNNREARFKISQIFG